MTRYVFLLHVAVTLCLQQGWDKGEAGEALSVQTLKMD